MWLTTRNVFLHPATTWKRKSPTLSYILHYIIDMGIFEELIHFRWSFVLKKLLWWVFGKVLTVLSEACNIHLTGWLLYYHCSPESVLALHCSMNTVLCYPCTIITNLDYSELRPCLTQLGYLSWYFLPSLSQLCLWSWKLVVTVLNISLHFWLFCFPDFQAFRLGFVLHPNHPA